MDRAKILEDINKERSRQDSLWSADFDSKNTINDWIAYITYYASQTATTEDSISNFVQSMVKTAALCVAAIETVEKNGDTAPRHFD